MRHLRLLVIVLMLGLPVTPARAVPTSVATYPGFDAPYIGSIDAQLPQIRSITPNDRAGLARRYSRLTAAGLRWAYAWVQWSDVHPTAEQWLWDQVDTRLRAAHDAGINLLLQIQTCDWSAPQAWAGPVRVNSRKPASVTCAYEDMGPVIDFWRTIVDRYRPGGAFATSEGWTDGYGVRAWEVENEPDNTLWWGSYRAVPDDYAEYLSKLFPAVKAIDPHAVIVAPALSQQGGDGLMGPSGLPWLDEMLSTRTTDNQSDTYRASGQVLGGGPYVDAYSWHFDTAPIGDGSVPARAKAILDTVASYGLQDVSPTRTDSTLWFTEGGTLQYESDTYRFANGQLQLAAQLHGAGVSKMLMEGGTQSSNDNWPTTPYYRALRALTKFFPDAGHVTKVDLDPRITAYRRTDPASGTYTWILWANDGPVGLPFSFTVPARTTQVDVTDAEFNVSRTGSSTVSLTAGDPSPVVIVAEVAQAQSVKNLRRRNRTAA